MGVREGDTLYFYSVLTNYISFLADVTSDDNDVTVRSLFSDVEFCQKYNISTLNSSNWCRIMVQIAHHFYAYFEVRDLVHMYLVSE